MGPESLCDDRPPHQLGNSKELEECGFGRYQGISRIKVDTVEEVGLFVVVRCQYYVIDYSL